MLLFYYHMTQFWIRILGDQSWSHTLQICVCLITRYLATELHIELKGLDALHSNSVNLAQLDIVKLYILVLWSLPLALLLCGGGGGRYKRQQQLLTWRREYWGKLEGTTLISVFIIISRLIRIVRHMTPDLKLYIRFKSLSSSRIYTSLFCPNFLF